MEPAQVYTCSKLFQQKTLCPTAPVFTLNPTISTCPGHQDYKVWLFNTPKNAPGPYDGQGANMKCNVIVASYKSSQLTRKWMDFPSWRPGWKVFSCTIKMVLFCQVFLILYNGREWIFTNERIEWPMNAINELHYATKNIPELVLCKIFE